MIDVMWVEIVIEDDVVIFCIIGGVCEVGEVGFMVLVELFVEDFVVWDKIVMDVVLVCWVECCGVDCVVNWNEIVGLIFGLIVVVK